MPNNSKAGESDLQGGMREASGQEALVDQRDSGAPPVSDENVAFPSTADPSEQAKAAMETLEQGVPDKEEDSASLIKEMKEIKSMYGKLEEQYKKLQSQTTPVQQQNSQLRSENEKLKQQQTLIQRNYEDLAAKTPQLMGEEEFDSLVSRLTEEKGLSEPRAIHKAETMRREKEKAYNDYQNNLKQAQHQWWNLQKQISLNTAKEHELFSSDERISQKAASLFDEVPQRAADYDFISNLVHYAATAMVYEDKILGGHKDEQHFKQVQQMGRSAYPNGRPPDVPPTTSGTHFGQGRPQTVTFKGLDGKPVEGGYLGSFDDLL